MSHRNGWRNEFRDFVSSLELERRYPAYRALASRSSSVRMRWPPYRIHTREGFPLHAIPPGKRDFYTAVVYIEPFSGRNLRAFVMTCIRYCASCP